MDVSSVADQLFFVTARINAWSESGDWVATGFFYEVETDKGNAHFLVTNKHVLEGATRLRISLVRAASASPALGVPSSITIDPFTEGSWLGHPDPSVDVAVMPFSMLGNALVEAGFAPFYRSLSPELCLNTTRSLELDALEDVVFVGYPSGLYDSTNLTPVLRRGITATPIMLDYEGRPVFLIDASVFPGSSGSPVLLYDRGVYATRDGTVSIGSRFMLLGVLAANATRAVEGQVIELPSRFLVRTEEALDLGVVFKAWTIDTCVDRILAQAGLARVLDEPISPTAEATEANATLAETEAAA